MFPCLFAKNVHRLIETATYQQVAFNLKESLSEFAQWTLQMPNGICRNRTDVHEWMIRVLNTCDEKHMDASTVAILLQLWGFPGDDIPHELNAISVDISYNFNRLNQQIYTPPSAASSDLLSSSSSNESSPLSMSEDDSN